MRKLHLRNPWQSSGAPDDDFLLHTHWKHFLDYPEYFKICRNTILGDPEAVSWVRKNGCESFPKRVREPLGYYTLNSASLFRMLVCDWAQKILLCPIRGQHLSHCIHDLLMRRSFTCKKWTGHSTLVKICLPPVWLVQELGELSSRRVFSENELSIYSTSLIRSSCITEEKILTTNLQTIKGERISLARAWQVCRAGVTNHADD